MELYREHYQPLVRLAHSLTGSRESAEEVVQDSFVKLHRSWDAAREPVGYLRAIVVNGCHSLTRRRPLAFGSPDPVHMEADEVFDVLSRLPYQQRVALVLRFYHGLNEKEIAATLGRRPGTVGSLIHRGLSRLRQELTP